MTCPPAPSATPRWRRRCGGASGRARLREKEDLPLSSAGGAPTRQRGDVSTLPPWSGQPSGPWSEACTPCSPQPHERDALLAGSLNTTLHLANEQERDDWPADGPKVPEPCSHHRGHGHSKHLSGSNVSFSRDPEGCEDEPGKVRGAESSPRSGSGRPASPAAGAQGVCSQPGGRRLKHSLSGPQAWPGRAPPVASLALAPPWISPLVMGAGRPLPPRHGLPGAPSEILSPRNTLHCFLLGLLTLFLGIARVLQDLEAAGTQERQGGGFWEGWGSVSMLWWEGGSSLRSTPHQSQPEAPCSLHVAPRRSLGWRASPTRRRTSCVTTTWRC